MSFLTAVRDRYSSRDDPQAVQAGDPQDRPDAEAAPPIADYDRLDDKQVMDRLSDHSQVELEAMESYERAHKNRMRVLDKLHYMRGSEPFPGYDALSVEEIVAALGQADLVAIKKVRAYERKFANRPGVMEEVVRVHAATGAKRRDDRTESGPG